MRRRSVTTRPLLTTAALAALIWALVPALASAHHAGTQAVAVDPLILISGPAREGEELTVTATGLGVPEDAVGWQWLRCSATNDDDCAPIAGATSATYVATAADVGSKLCVELRVLDTNVLHHADEHTPVIQVAPPPLPPLLPPAEPPSPPPTPGVTPAATPGAGSQASFPPRMLDPFPVVRIRGMLTPAGARITLFTIRVPRSVAVQVRCRGRSCRGQGFAGRASNSSLIRLRRFERPLRAGTRLAIKVTRAGRIGKWTTILIRRGSAPKRSDQCAYPDAKAPAPCPSD